MFEWLSDAVGPLAAGVLLLGVAPAAALIIAMATITRLVEWRTGRAPSPLETATPRLEVADRNPSP